MQIKDFAKSLQNVIELNKNVVIKPNANGTWPAVICGWRPVFHGYVCLGSSTGTTLGVALLYYNAGRTEDISPEMLVAIPGTGAFYMKQMIVLDEYGYSPVIQGLHWNSKADKYNFIDFINWQMRHLIKASQHYGPRAYGTYSSEYCVGGQTPVDLNIREADEINEDDLIAAADVFDRVVNQIEKGSE